MRQKRLLASILALPIGPAENIADMLEGSLNGGTGCRNGGVLLGFDHQPAAVATLPDGGVPDCAHADF